MVIPKFKNKTPLKKKMVIPKIKNKPLVIPKFNNPRPVRGDLYWPQKCRKIALTAVLASHQFSNTGKHSVSASRGTLSGTCVHNLFFLIFLADSEN